MGRLRGVLTIRNALDGGLLPAQTPRRRKCLHVVLPTKQEQTHGKTFKVRENANQDRRADQPFRAAEANDRDERSRHDQAPAFGKIRVVAGGLAELGEIEDVASAFECEEHGQQMPVAIQNLRLP